MLKHAAVSSDGRESRGKAAAVVADSVAVARLNDVGELAPARARRVRDDRVRPRVGASVAELVPGVDVGEAVVRAASVDVEGSYHGLCPSRRVVSATAHVSARCGLMRRR